MLRKWHVNRLSMVVVIIFTIFLTFYAAQDATAFEVAPLTDIEMEEISGGFQMQNGSFVYFGIDVIMDDFYTSEYDTITGPGILGGINILGSLNIKENIGITTTGVIVGNNNILTQTINIGLAHFQVTSADQIKPILSNWTHLVF